MCRSALTNVFAIYLMPTASGSRRSIPLCHKSSTLLATFAARSIDKVTAQFGGYGRQELYVPDFELAATNSNRLVKRLSQLFRAGKQTRSGRKRVCWDVRRSKYVFRT